MDTNSEPALTAGIIFSDGVIRELGTGKCSFIGSFGAYNLPTLPFKVFPFWVTALVTNLGAESKSVDVTVRVENPKTGMVIASSSVKMNLPNGAQRGQVYEVTIPVANMVIPEAGVYSTAILVNNEKVGERSLPAMDMRAKGATT